jgi:hypothetical protein
MSPEEENQNTDQVDQSPTEIEKIRGLPWAISFSSLNAFFTQLTFFGSVFVLFLNELGLTKSQIGFVIALLPFFDLISLGVAPITSRIGYKRTLLTFWSLRTAVAGFALLTPWVARNYGTAGALYFISATIMVFAICRSIAVTGYYPWQQEFIPASIRGKFSATNQIFVNIAALLAVSGAGIIVNRSERIERFIFLFGIAIVFAVGAVLAASRIPGGAPITDLSPRDRSLRNRLATLKDRNFLYYLLGSGLVTLSIVPMTTFVPLYMQEKIGLAAGNIILLQNGTLVGSLLLSSLWGWTSDRYGSKPVMLTGVYLLLTLPLLWLLLPFAGVWSLAFALGIAFLQGIATMAWTIGSSRMLFVNIVPQEKKIGYMAVYAAWVGIVSGASQLFAGRLLEALSNLNARLFIFEINAYSVFFLIALSLTGLSAVLISIVQSGDRVSVGEFAGLFLHGNPLMAAESMIRYHMARDERTTIAVTERLGQSNSPLTVEELIDAIQDPRFYVRFESMVSIARRASDDRLNHALTETLNGRDPAMSVVAAWALGRIGDQHAVAALIDGLKSQYRSVRAHCARSLGSLGDESARPVLMKLLKNETDPGLRLAYAASLAHLGESDVVPDLLNMLEKRSDKLERDEISLAVARILGNENHFLQLLRNLQDDPGTSVAREIDDFLTRLDEQIRKQHPEMTAVLEQARDSYAHANLKAGGMALLHAVDEMPDRLFSPSAEIVLEACRLNFYPQHHRRTRHYLMLILHIFNVDSLESAL